MDNDGIRLFRRQMGTWHHRCMCMLPFVLNSPKMVIAGLIHQILDTTSGTSY